MFKFGKINALFNCEICQEILKEPIILPCGKTICKAHSEEISKDKCILCNKTHKIPEDGFLINELVQNIIENKLHTLDLNFDQFKNSREIIENLNKRLKEIEAIRNDPDNFIAEYFYELNRQVDLRREKLFQEIQQYSDELIQKIDVLRQECLNNSKNTKIKMTEEIDECKSKIEKLNLMFNSFEIDNGKLEEIMHQKMSKELEELMKPISQEYKLEILGNKSYSLSTSDFNICRVFGSLEYFENVKIILD